MECPTCKKVFKTPRGLNIHIPQCQATIVCDKCNREFTCNKTYHNHKRTCLLHYSSEQIDEIKKKHEADIEAVRQEYVSKLKSEMAKEEARYESTLQILKKDFKDAKANYEATIYRYDIEIKELKRDAKEKEKLFDSKLYDQEVKYEARIVGLEQVISDQRKEIAALTNKAIENSKRIIYNTNNNQTTHQNIIHLESVKVQELQHVIRDYLLSPIKKQEYTLASTVIGAVKNKVVKTDGSRNKIEWVNENNVRIYDSNGREFTQYLLDNSTQLFEERLDDMEQALTQAIADNRDSTEIDQTIHFLERVIKRDESLTEKVGKIIAKLTHHKKNFQALHQIEDKWKFWKERLYEELQHFGCFAFTQGGEGVARWLMERLGDEISLPNYGEENVLQIIGPEGQHMTMTQEDLGTCFSVVCNFEELHEECVRQLCCCLDDAFEDIDNAGTDKTKREMATLTFTQTFLACKDKHNPIYEVVYETLLMG